MNTVDQISFNKNVLGLIKDLSVISNEVVFTKKDDSIIISQSNKSESLGFILKTSIDNFKFDSEQLAFYDFREFYQLVDVFENAKLSINDKNIIISNDKTKIKYLLSDESTISCGPEEIPFTDEFVSISISSDELNEIRKMLNVLFAKVNGMMIKVRLSVEKDLLTLTFFTEDFENSFERKYEIKNDNEFEYIASAEMFTDIPRGDYKVDIHKDGIVRLTLDSKDANVEIFTGEVTN